MLSRTSRAILRHWNSLPPDERRAEIDATANQISAYIKASLDAEREWRWSVSTLRQCRHSWLATVWEMVTLR